MCASVECNSTLTGLRGSDISPCLTFQVDVNTEVGVIHDYALRELRLFTDYGRTSRPLFIVDENNQLVFKRKHLRQLLER